MEDIMADYDEDETFFEEDEPVEAVRAAFERGEKGVTAPLDAWIVGASITVGTAANVEPVALVVSGSATQAGSPVPVS